MIEKKREVFLDVLRLAAICAVVLLHTMTGIMDNVDMSQYPVADKVFLIIMDLICWAVPIFIMISGYLFLNLEKEMSLRKLLLKYCRRIVFALFLFGVPYACLELLAVEKTFRLNMLVKGIVMVLKGDTWSHMWYLYLVLFLYLVTPLIRMFLRVSPKWIVRIVLLLLFVCCSIMPYLRYFIGDNLFTMFPEDGIYFFYYICGFLFVCYDVGEVPDVRKMPDTGKEILSETVREKNIQSIKNRHIVRVCFGIILLSVTVIVYGRVSGIILFRTAYGYITTVLLTLSIFAAAKYSPEISIAQSNEMGKGTKRTGLVQKLASLSFTIYLIHPVFLNVYYKFLHLSPLDYDIRWSLPFFFLATLIPSTIVAGLLCRIPLLRKYVL